MVFRPLIGLNKNEIIDYAQKSELIRPLLSLTMTLLFDAGAKATGHSGQSGLLPQFLKEHPIEEMIEAALLETQQYIFNRRGNFRD